MLSRDVAFLAWVLTEMKKDGIWRGNTPLKKNPFEGVEGCSNYKQKKDKTLRKSWISDKWTIHLDNMAVMNTFSAGILQLEKLLFSSSFPNSAFPGGIHLISWAAGFPCPTASIHLFAPPSSSCGNQDFLTSLLNSFASWTFVLLQNVFLGFRRDCFETFANLESASEIWLRTETAIENCIQEFCCHSLATKIICLFLIFFNYQIQILDAVLGNKFGT